MLSNSPALPTAVARLLTPRECEVVSYLATGRPNKVVAIELGISLRTAEAHRARIFRKLGVRNTVELACSLCRHGSCRRWAPVATAGATDACFSPRPAALPADHAGGARPRGTGSGCGTPC